MLLWVMGVGFDKKGEEIHYIYNKNVFKSWPQYNINMLCRALYDEKKTKIDVCCFEWTVIPSAMFIIPSIACCKLPSPSF